MVGLSIHLIDFAMPNPLDIQLPETTRGTLRDAYANEWPELGRITAEAFKEDPFNLWLFGNDDLVASTYQLMARAIYLQNGFCHINPTKGATMWLPPGASKDLPLLDTIKFALRVLFTRGPGQVLRLLKADAALLKKRPETPHVYLFTIGVLLSARGTGFGRTLMRPVLDACDKAGLPVYLESSNPDNHGFYAALGFKTLEKFYPMEGSPVMESMWRAPARAQSG
jgi:GNAT superfamily N-acetyltransferase